MSLYVEKADPIYQCYRRRTVTNYNEAYTLFGFYQHELKQNMLGFWLPRCVDEEFGGFLNCFDNRGENLVSMTNMHGAKAGLCGCLHAWRQRKRRFSIRRNGGISYIWLNMAQSF